MKLVSTGYYPQSGTNNLEHDWQLFCNHLDLLLENEQIIFNCADYFFCHPSFSHCSWAYISHDGELPVGYLLLAWGTGTLTEQCPTCKGKVLITSFAGSPLSGGNTFTGLCVGDCRLKKRGKDSTKFKLWMDFVLKLRKTFPDKVSKVEDYQSQEFDWKLGLKPALKKRTSWLPVACPVTLEVLIDELRLGKFRPGKPVNVALLKQDFQLKFAKGSISL